MSGRIDCTYSFTQEQLLEIERKSIEALQELQTWQLEQKLAEQQKCTCCPVHGNHRYA